MTTLITKGSKQGKDIRKIKIKMKNFYIDDEEEGVARKTCHPNFNSVLKNDLYINIIDELSPFGNDEGWETLRALEKWYLNEYNDDSLILDFITDYSTINWGWSEVDLPKLQILDINKINEIQKEEEDFLVIFPQIVIATGFGQFKITGRMDDYLKEILQKIIEQQKIIAQQKIAKKEVDLSKLLKVVDGVSTRVNNEGNMNHILEAYIARLTKMNIDLEKIPMNINE